MGSTAWEQCHPWGSSAKHRTQAEKGEHTGSWGDCGGGEEGGNQGRAGVGGQGGIRQRWAGIGGMQHESSILEKPSVLLGAGD